MPDAKIKANEIRALVRCANIAFTLRCEDPELFGAYTVDIDKAADALVSIRAKLTDKQAQYVFGDSDT